MTPSTVLMSTLCQTLSASAAPVERDIARLLADGLADATAAFRLQRYQRKVDVARRLMSAYDEGLVQATNSQAVCSAAYLGLAWVFAQAAGSRATLAERLCWANSAFNCLDHVVDQPNLQAKAELEAALHAMLQAVVWP